MNFKLAVVLLGLVALFGVHASVIPIEKPEAPEVGTVYANVYDGPNETGNMRTITSYISNLGNAGLGNAISSSCSTGIWIYYQNNNYNYGQSAPVSWMHGIRYCTNFGALNNKANSVRYAGSNTVLDESTFSLYEGQGFMGQELYGETSQADLRDFNAKAQSVIVTGTSGWTFYTGSNYSGYSTCVRYTTTDSASGQTMHLALYAKIPNSVFVKSIRSVRKGCFSDNIMEAVPLTATHKDDNGAMGSFNIDEL